MQSIFEELEQRSSNHRCRQSQERTAANVLHASECLRRSMEKLLHRARNMNRPSVMLRPELSCFASVTDDREFWTASYGALIAQGDTPEEAFQAFDEAWINGGN